MSLSQYRAEIALNRFSYGAKPGQLADYKTAPVEKLIAQLVSAHYPAATWTSIDALRAVDHFNQSKRASKAKEKGMPAVTNQRDPVMSPKMLRQSIKKQSRLLTKATFDHAITSDDGFQARLVDFFSNHFSVSAQGLKMSALAPTLEREAIVPHLSGQFYQLLIAVETHPAMILYLNNERSVGEMSKVGKRVDKRGINENLAREILELHTVGVDGGYKQTDVEELAKAITGWTVTAKNHQPDVSPGFYFKPQFHQPGNRQVLGKRYPQSGVEQGQAIMKDLAAHPSTAWYLSHKLARHFVADNPTSGLVKGMAAQWIKTDGHIPSVLEAMLKHRDSWLTQPQKLKTPREFVISACRACGVKNTKRPGPFEALLLLGQQPFAAGSPAGYEDLASAWNGAEALMAKIEWAEHLAASSRLAPSQAAEQALGAQLSLRTRKHIERAESREQALALLLMSPDFQRR